jgi:hypothetical protein
MKTNSKLLLDAIRVVDNNINTSIRSSGELAHNDLYLTLFFFLSYLHIPMMFNSTSTATEVAKALATPIRGKTGETTSRIWLLRFEISILLL